MASQLGLGLMVLQWKEDRMSGRDGGFFLKSTHDIGGMNRVSKAPQLLSGELLSTGLSSLCRGRNGRSATYDLSNSAQQQAL